MKINVDIALYIRHQETELKCYLMLLYRSYRQHLLQLAQVTEQFPPLLTAHPSCLF